MRRTNPGTALAEHVAWPSRLVVTGVLAAMAWFGSDPAAHAQRAAVVAGGNDLRPVYATAQDVADGKRLAETTCAKCHGAEGISVTAGTPHLAGQRAAYVYRELRAYQSGARRGDAMNGAVKSLSNDALSSVAAYYASADPAPPAQMSDPPAEQDPVVAGKAAAAACAGCHGETGISAMAGMPSLVGQDPKYLIATMTAYKTGQRKDAIMKTMVAALDDAVSGNVALYYALQKPARAQTPAPGDQAAGQASAAACAGCHGNQGISVNAATPGLAGQDAGYLVTALNAYKDGSRADPTMKALAATLDDATMRNLAAFYAVQQPRPPNVRKPLNTADWIQRCDRCHGPNGNSADPRIPALAGQRMEYLETVLRAYQAGTRKSSEMTAMSAGLTDANVASLADWYARQKPRPVVYVTVPAR